MTPDEIKAVRAAAERSYLDCSECLMAAVQEKLRASEARYRGLAMAVRELLANSPFALADDGDDARYQKAKAKVKKLIGGGQ